MLTLGDRHYTTVACSLSHRLARLARRRSSSSSSSVKSIVAHYHEG